MYHFVEGKGETSQIESVILSARGRCLEGWEVFPAFLSYSFSLLSLCALLITPDTI